MEDGPIKRKIALRHNEFIKEEKPSLYNNMVNLNIGVTNICNSDCIFCFASMLPQKKHIIDKELARRLLVEGSRLGIKELNLYGNYGDPFTCQDIYDYVIYAKQLGYSYIFTNTNGIALTGDNAYKAVACGFDSIRISVNAGTSETYAKIHGVSAKIFSQVLDNIRLLHYYKRKLGSKIVLSVSYVVFDQNRDELQILEKLVKDYVDDFVVFTLMNPRYAFSDLELIDRSSNLIGCAKQSNHGCNRPFNSIYINQDGLMTLCALDEGGFGAIADMHYHTIESAWFSERFVQIRQRHIQNNLSGMVCNNCLNCCHSIISPLFDEFVGVAGKQSYSIATNIIKRGL